MKKQIATILFVEIFIFFLISANVLAQKTVLGMPVNYHPPIDYLDNSAQYESFLMATSPKSKEVGWMVFSDRNNNPVYDKPNGSVIENINFRDYFYVVAEKGHWIKIVKARVNRLKIIKKKDGNTIKDIGWVEKKKMLLWNYGLIGQNTRIHKKVLLLNRADAIEEVLQKKKKSLVKVFKGPRTSEMEPDRRIFEFYFLLKKEGDRYLLAEEVSVSPYNLYQIVGWVRESDCTKWDTRICLEPNFTKEGFNERLSNKKLRIRAYKSLVGAIEGERDRRDQTDVFWDNDPVLLKRDVMAVSNSRRFKGQVVRFPMASVTQKNGIEYFRSGLVGSITIKGGNGGFTQIPEQVLTQLKTQQNELANKSNNVNFFFVIEGTNEVNPYQKQIVQSIKNISNDQAVGAIQQVKYGALVYRDIPEEHGRINGQLSNRMIESISLTPDIDKVTGFLENVKFKNTVDRDEYTALYYGLFQAIQKAGFRSDELNIIMMIGCYGDFRADRDRRLEAKNHPALFTTDDIEKNIIANLDRINAHLYAVQLLNDSYRPAQAYSKAIQSLMLENAKSAYNWRRGFVDANSDLKRQLDKAHYSDAVPWMELKDNEEKSSLYGSIPGNLLRPISAERITPNKLDDQLMSNAKESIYLISQLKAAFFNVLIQGDEPINREPGKRGSGQLTRAFYAMLIKTLKENPNIDVRDILGEKYTLFTEVYIPYIYKDAHYPLISYVLFMPETDLLDYTHTIERFKTAEGLSTYDRKREALFEVYKQLVEKFTGEGPKPSIKVEDFSREELKELMQGVYHLGLHMEDPLDHRLGDVLDEKKMSNEQIDELIQRFRDVGNNLKKILRLRERYDFCYQTEKPDPDDPSKMIYPNRYYWIALEDAF